MAQSLIVRPIVASDRPEWERLWTGYLQFYETSVSPAVYDTTFARLLSGAQGEYRGLIATLQDRPVGLVHFLSHRHCWSEANVTYLQDLFADPDVRGTGVGRALIEAVYAAADAEGAAQVYWMTQDTNATARKLYDRIGRLTPLVKYQRR